MGKYSSNSTRRELRKPDGPHYAWRGIGCLMMIIIPIISFAAGVETIKYGLAAGWPLPYELLGTPQLPALFYRSSGLMILFRPILNTPNFYAYLVFGFLYMILIGGVISVVYALMYRAVSPASRNPLDVPPPKYKAKRYKR
jgi:hypothetical protein